MSDPVAKKEKKDKKRKSQAADLSMASVTEAVQPIPVPPPPGTASAEAVVMEVDAERAAKKAKKEKRKSLAAGEESIVVEGQEVKPEFYVPPDAISPIASPLAGRKLSKKVFKTVKRSSKVRQLRRGVKEVVKALRKGEKGLLVLASNITPVDVISHLPLLAEEAAGVEYCWVLSKEELGAAGGTKRATSCVLVSSAVVKKTPASGAVAKPAISPEDIKEWEQGLKECMEEVKKLDYVGAVQY